MKRRTTLILLLCAVCAVPIALIISGLPTSTYTFKGFPPRKGGPLRRFFEQDRDLPHSLVVFESPYRVAATLAAAYEVLGNRLAAVCVELTKKFERADRGSLSQLAELYDGRTTKGEVTIVIAGNNPKFLVVDDVDQSVVDSGSSKRT